MRIRSYNPKMALLGGKKPSGTDNIINLQSDLTHTEIQFGANRNYVSWSATMADDCKCCRFKMISYSHPIRWSTVEFSPSEAQEELMWRKACAMADMDSNWLEGLAVDPDGIWYGTEAIEYDLKGLLSFKTPIKPHRVKVWCTEGCFEVLLEAYPTILMFPMELLNPDDLDPTMGDWIARYYFENIA